MSLALIEADAALQNAFDPVLELFFIVIGVPYSHMDVEMWMNNNSNRFIGAFEAMERYLELSEQQVMPEAMTQKFEMLRNLLGWMSDAYGDEDLDGLEFGDDVEKSGYTREEVIAHSVLQEFGKAKLVFEQPHCTICLQEFCRNESVRKLNCQHIFHDACVESWLAKSTTCPVCVKDVLAAPPVFVNTSSKKRRFTRPSAPVEATRCSKRLRGIAPE